MVDRDKASRLLGELTGSLADLRRYRDHVTRHALNTVRDTQHMVLRALYVAAQAAVDLAMHLGADAGLPPAATYQEAFHRLADAGLVERDLADRLAAWAGFRNVLAHSYASVNYDRAYDALGEIGDLERFAVLVAARIDASG
jgi:uncharacterized protein YutE (UPF0331/DUF86 family)